MVLNIYDGMQGSGERTCICSKGFTTSKDGLGMDYNIVKKAPPILANWTY